MRDITITQEVQPDGSIHHVPANGCSISPCAVIHKQGEFPDICTHLYVGAVDLEGTLVWKCGGCE